MTEGQPPNEDAIAFLSGEVHALLIVCQALFLSHPDPERAVSELERAEQIGLAKVEGEPVADATVLGFQFVMDHVRKIAEAAAGNRHS